MPIAINPRRIPQRLVLNEVASRAIPIAMPENIIVFRWVRRDEINPDASRVVKYPREIRKNRDPASAWLKARSDLTLGIKGARIMREIKFTKNKEVISKSGVSWVRNASWA
jgi:hypothetical protein